MSFLIRVQIPDQPGTLGSVASALGGIGADILSVDVVERGGGVAIDDLVVELPSGRLPDVLITAAESVPGVEVESVRPHFGQLDTHHELELIEEVTGDPERGLALLAEGVPRIFRAGWALVAAREDGTSYRLAESAAAPETRAGDLPWMPLEKATVLDPAVHWMPEPWSALDTELGVLKTGKEADVFLLERAARHAAGRGETCLLAAKRYRDGDPVETTLAALLASAEAEEEAYRRESVAEHFEEEPAEVVAFEPPTHLAYVLRKGLPIQGYRADVTLAPTPSGGTDITWASTWDADTGPTTFWRRFLTFTLGRVARDLAKS